MKKIILCSVFILFFIADMHGQTIALNTFAKQDLVAYSPASFMALRNRPAPPNALMIVGGCSIGIGIPLVLYGLVVQYDSYSWANETTNQAEWQKGNRIIIAGSAIAIAGLGMVIVGGIRHHRDYYRGWSVIARKNEVGLACNF